MKKLILTILSVCCLFSCMLDKRMGPDYDKIKSELQLDADKEQQFDAITDKYTEKRKAYFSEAKSSGKMNRLKMIAQLASLVEAQNEEMADVLSASQLEKFKAFVDKAMPKNPNYSDALLAEMQSELKMNPEQDKLFSAINNAFVKAYLDAHDKYHGDNEAAKEYWTQFDNERKTAMKKVLSEEQYEAYLKLSEKEGFVGRE